MRCYYFTNPLASHYRLWLRVGYILLLSYYYIQLQSFSGKYMLRCNKYERPSKQLVTRIGYDNKVKSPVVTFTRST